MRPAKVSPKQLAALQGGIELHNQGRLEQADEIYRKFLRDVPAHPDALHLRALVAHARGDFANAARFAEGAIAQAPGIANFHNTAGEARRRGQHTAQALDRLREAVRLDPAFAIAHQNLALALADAGRPEQALASCRKALALNPALLDARIALVDLLGLSADFSDAACAQAKALASQANEARAREVAARFFARRGRAHLDRLGFEQARADARDALSVDPSFWGGWAILGEADNELGEFERAELDCSIAANLAPDNKNARLNLAHLLREQQRVAEAQSHYGAWLERSPQDANARFGRAVARLARGDYAGGWPDYESRWAIGTSADPFQALPRWTGQACASLLIYPEQGLGDFLQMLRFIPPAASHCGGHVTVLAPAPLERLVRRNLPVAIEVLTELAPGRRFDHACPVMSLPLALHADSAERISAGTPYLSADAQHCAKLRDALSAFPGKKLGIVWRGAAGGAVNRRRALPDAALQPLLAMPGWTPVSLQFGVKDPAIGARRLVDLSAQISDFEDLAAAMQVMDAVVSLDTGPAHLAGGMGLTCHTLLPRLHDWRWGAAGDSCDWYPSMRLLRQPQDGSWEGPIRQLIAMLGGLPVEPVPVTARPPLVENNEFPQIRLRGRYGSFAVALLDPAVTRSLLLYGEHLPRLAALLASYLRPGDTAVEVGANLGTLTLPLAQAVGRGGKVVAFEPQADRHACLAWTLHRNGAAQVDLRTAVAFETPDLASCRLLRIEAAGNEQSVLDAAAGLLARSRAVISVAGDKDTLQQIGGKLRGRDYRVFLLEEPLFPQTNQRNCAYDVFGGAVSHSLLALPGAEAAPAGATPV